jgi:hypothetical protein
MTDPIIYGSTEKGPRGFEFSVCDAATGRVLFTGVTPRWESIVAEAETGRQIYVGRKLLKDLEYMDGGVPKHITQYSSSEIDAVNEELLASIDQSAEYVRGLFITNTASQPSVYLAKESEARALMLNPSLSDASTPHLTIEAAQSGQTRAAVAVVIVAQADAWRQISASIEGLRLAAKNAVRSAPTITAKRAAAVIDWSAITSLA